MKIEDLKYSEKIAKEIADITAGKSDTPLNLGKMINEQGDEVEQLIDRLNDKSRQEFMNDTINSSDGNKGAKRLMESINKKRSNQQRRAYITITSTVAAMMAAVILFTWKTNNENTTEIIKVVENKPLLITKRGNYNLDSIDIIKKTIGNNIENTSHNTIVYGSSTATAEIEYNEIVIPANYTYHVTFSDGTDVMLNAGSRLKYPIVFTDSTRIIELNGEAYFKVAKSQKPFIVKTNGIQVRVYGTEFNINSYCKNHIKTVLVEGSVGVSFDDKNQHMIIPNQIAICNMETQHMEIEETYVKNHISWIDGDFQYRNASLTDVIDDIAKWYDVNFSCATNIADINISFYAKREQNINDIIKLIEQVTDVKFIKEREKVYSIERK